METGPLDTWIVGYFTIITSNLDVTSSLQLELPKLDNDEELNFEFLDQEHYFIESYIGSITILFREDYYKGRKNFLVEYFESEAICNILSWFGLNVFLYPRST